MKAALGYTAIPPLSSGGDVALPLGPIPPIFRKECLMLRATMYLALAALLGLNTTHAADQTTAAGHAKSQAKPAIVQKTPAKIATEKTAKSSKPAAKKAVAKTGPAKKAKAKPAAKKSIAAAKPKAKKANVNQLAAARNSLTAAQGNVAKAENQLPRRGQGRRGANTLSGRNRGRSNRQAQGPCAAQKKMQAEAKTTCRRGNERQEGRCGEAREGTRRRQADETNRCGQEGGRSQAGQANCRR